ncbi:unnamed protein product [Angiostrongylus costaricensis]|uniref:RNase H domain-containing protein n=1 Tax=Angiostrongylus costaricensis TaxID=334426 RepID=A0A0R3PTR1_ANGCS|nr:unnamed protein product [Angiostrongylus costaricensis]
MFTSFEYKCVNQPDSHTFISLYFSSFNHHLLFLIGPDRGSEIGAKCSRRQTSNEGVAIEQALNVAFVDASELLLHLSHRPPPPPSPTMTTRLMCSPQFYVRTAVYPYISFF